MKYENIFLNENFRDMVWIIYASLLGTFGNILYRINNRLKISPLVNRILYGLMAVAIYVGFVLYMTREKPKLNMIVMLMIFFIAYFTELLIEILEDRLPSFIDRLIDKILNDRNKKDDSGNDSLRGDSYEN